jgi:peptide-methionine (S)-S-oxide reductase
VVGYSGGKLPNPTYQRIKDHTEALLVEYDPAEIRYDELLVKWARNAFPYGKAKTQYRNAIFFTNFDQQDVAEELCAKIREQGKAKGQAVHIDIEPVTKFYKAEGYHQDFLAKRGA